MKRTVEEGISNEQKKKALKKKEVRSRNGRSWCSQILIKVSVIKNFAILKTPVLESLFKKVADLEAHKSIKRRLQHRCFPVNIAKFLSTAFSIAHLWWLLLELRHFFSL